MESFPRNALLYLDIIMKIEKLPIAFFFIYLFIIGCGGSGDSLNQGVSQETDTFKTMTAHWNHVSVNASGYDHT